MTAAAWSANVANITVSNAHGTIPFAAGQDVTIAGMTPAAYNGTYTILSVNTSTNTFTVALPLSSNPGNGTGFGTATDAGCYTVASTLVGGDFTLNTGVGVNAGTPSTLVLGGVTVTRAPFTPA